MIQQSTPHSSSHQSSQGQSGQSQQQQTVGVVRLNSTDSSKGNSSPAQIIATSPTALATATQVGVDGVCIKKSLSCLIGSLLYIFLCFDKENRKTIEKME